MATTASPAELPRACLRPLQQPPLDAITVYDTATHCYLLASDSLQRDYHLLTCRKHSLDEVAFSARSTNVSSNTNTSFDVDDEEASFEGRSSFSMRQQHAPQSFCSLEDLHDFTTYAVYSPTEAASLVEALQREHGASMHVLSAVALIGAVRFTEGYYVVLITERRVAGHIGVHRLFEAAQVELVSLLLDHEWVSAQARAQRQQQQQQRRGEEMAGLSSLTEGGGSAASPRLVPRVTSSYRKSSSSATAAAAAYLFQRRPLEELYRQQFLGSLSRSSSFFYSHSYDLTNTLQRNMLADGAAATPVRNAHAQTSPASTSAGGSSGVMAQWDGFHPPRMQYVWNEYLLEPWQLPSRPAEAAHSLQGSDGDEPQPSPRCSPTSLLPPPQYPAPFARWRTFLIHGFITQRTVVVRRPTFHTHLLTLIARVSKSAAGVRYLRRGINSDGNVANHVEVEQIVSDESAWNALFTEGALSSYVQLRGSVPVRWYHPPTASRLLPKPPIVLGPGDAEWSATCLHFQDLLRQYGGPVLAHDLLKRKEHHTRESALGEAFRAAAHALSAAVARGTSSASSEAEEGALRCCDVLQYESTDLRDLGPLAWNNMTAYAEHHFDQVHCFVCRRQRQQSTGAESDGGGAFPPNPAAAATSSSPSASLRDYAITEEDCPSVAVQVQCGVVRSNCLDCIDRTNLGQLFHGLHALGEQLAGLGPLRHAADLRDSPAVTELLLDMYLAMGDALATQYGGSAQVGAGVLHRGAGWDQLMGVKRLYNNVMGDRDKQEAITLLLGRTQPHPRRQSRARNAAMQIPGQALPFVVTNSLSAAPSLNASVTSATPGAVAAASRAAALQRSFSHSNNELALVPTTSAPSLFSGLLNAAARWWGEANRSSSAAAATTAAAVEALRAAQHAAAEAEAEPDYYAHVSAGPRLPPAGLLASWWVQPLKDFAEWYAACGIVIDRRSGRGEEQPLTTSEKSDGPELQSTVSPTSTPSRSNTTTTTTPAAVMGDAFAQHILAAEREATQRWLLFVARWERQLCLAPAQRNGVGGAAAAAAVSATPSPLVYGSGSSSPLRRSLTASPLVDRGIAFPGRVGGLGGGAALAATGSVLRPSVSTWGVDEAGPAAASMLSDGDGSLLPASVSAVVSGGGGSGSAGPAAGVGSGAESSSPFAPFSLTLTPSLFVQPWTVLRTTSHILPIPDTTAPPSTSTRAEADRSAGVAMPLRLLYAWRREKAGEGAAPASMPRATLRAKRLEYGGCSSSWPVSEAVAASVLRAIFGVPPSAATLAALESRQRWRCAETPHDHRGFPRTVHTSVFAKQADALAQVACWETMGIADTNAERGATSTSREKKGGRSPETRRAALPPQSHSSQRKQQPQQRERAAAVALDPAVVSEDRCFAAALLRELYGSPETWKAEQVVVVLQRLLLPALLPSAVQRILCGPGVQPPISGSEVQQQGAISMGRDRESTCDYWKGRLTAAAVAPPRNTSSTSTTPPPTPPPPPQQQQQQQQHQRKVATFDSSASADTVLVAASLLSRLAAILGTAALSTTAPTAAAQHDLTSPSSSPISQAPPGQLTAGDAAADGFSLARQLREAAVVPLLETVTTDDVSAATRLAIMLPDHPSLSESMRRLWVLCRLLQPLFTSCVLSPSVLPGVLRALFSEALSSASSSSDCACGGLLIVRRAPFRTRHHVRYTFALSPQSSAVQQHQQQQQQRQQQSQQQVRSQLAAGALVGGMGSKRGGGEEGDNAHPASSPPLSSPSAGSSSSPSMHIPATLEVRHCCTALELYTWCLHYRTQCRRAHAAEEPRHALADTTNTSDVDTGAARRPDLPRSTLRPTSQQRVSDEDAAEAPWRLLWWAVENNLVVPVVRLREQTTLEILADETALFCVVEQLSRVAVNVERRSRAEVFRPASPSCHTTPASIRHGHTALTAVQEGGGGSAIYGVYLTAAFPVHRLTRRSALTDMVALSETVASLGLSAATRLQEFFRDYVQHGWAKTTLRGGGGGGGGGGAAAGTTSATATTVALFGGGGVTATVASRGRGPANLSGNPHNAGGPSASSPAAEAAVAASPADVVLHFSQLADECLQSIQSVMVALQFVSLDALADDHALHAYITFFVNVYNAAYVVAWLTNVKELVSHAALAARRMSNGSVGGGSSSSNNAAAAASAAAGVARADRHSGVSPALTLRTIDLLSLPTLCNTNLACFLHVYGVVVGHVFLSLAEMKYGILGGNRAPPFRDAPLWSPSPHTPPQQPQQQFAFSEGGQTGGSWSWQRQVPPHLRVALPESARLAALRRNPHVLAALHLKELGDIYGGHGRATARGQDTVEGWGGGGSTTAGSSLTAPVQHHSANYVGTQDRRASSFSLANASFSSLPSRGASQPAMATTPPLHGILPTPPSSTAAAAAASAATVAGEAAAASSTTPAFMRQRQRYEELLALWSSDVVRHLHFRTSLQLIDTYLPPPLFHWCHAADGSSSSGGNNLYTNSSGGGAAQREDGGVSGTAAAGNARSPSLDTHYRLDVDGERVPWYLQPILNTMPLVHPALQTSRLGVVYGVARDDDGRANGTLKPQVSPDANGVLLQPCRMWSSPSYYLVGGDGMNGEVAITHSFQLLQSLSGSYLGLHGYRGGDGNGTAVQQHLCSPLHHDDVLEQLHATERAFRSALRSTDPHLFPETSQSTQPSSGATAPQSLQQRRAALLRVDTLGSASSLDTRWGTGASSSTSCTALLHNAMKPLLYEWCRATDEGMESISLLARPGSQLRLLLKVVRLLEESYISAETVRQLQKAVREAE